MSFILIILVVVFIVYFLTKQQSSQNNNNRTNQRMWADTARYLNLQLFPPNEKNVFPSMTGVVGGIPVEIWGDFDEKGYGLIFCKTTFVQNLSFRLNIIKGNFEKDSIGSNFEISGLSSAGVYVTASNGAELQKFLSEKNLNILKNCFGTAYCGKMTGSFLIIGASGINDGGSLSCFIGRVAEAAKVLSGGHAVSSSAPLPKIIPVGEEFDVPPVQPKKPSPPQPPKPTPVPPPQPLKPAPVPPPQPLKPAPVPPPQPLKPTPVPPPEPEKQISEPAPAEDLSAEGLATALFSASFAGEKEKTLFRQHIGKTVQWSGTLKSIYPYSTDFVFGKGPGAKATFEICEVASGYGMKNKIKATVSFGEDVLPVLKGKNGQKFEFTGVLLKFEPFAREILLEKGSLQG